MSRRTAARIANLALLVAIAIAIGVFGIRGLASRRSVPVPDVRGMTPVAALSALSSARLVGRLAEALSDTTVEPGRIATQQPSAGTLVRRETIVRVNPSSGPEFVAVPDVRGHSLDSARAMIAAAGFIPGSVDTVRDSTPASRVVLTQPVPGTRARRSSLVAITLSGSASSVAVPELVGLTRTEAIARLGTVGLKAGAIRMVSEGVPGRVAGQRPEAGGMVAVGSEVELIINEARP